MQRRKTRTIHIGSVAVGSSSPVSVQTMTKTHTSDVDATLAQIASVTSAGADIVRLAVPDEDSASALESITADSPIPIVADIHFRADLAVASIDNGAAAIRINPGNMPLDGLRDVVSAAKSAAVPIRIGLNSGSVRRHGEKTSSETDLADLMVDRALEYARRFESWDFHDVKLSLKASTAAATIYAYRKAAPLCDYPLHLGVTATGPSEYAVIKSAVGIGALLSEGIGDTIRVSLTGPPEAEVLAGRRILASLGLLTLPYEVVACPTCGRTLVDLVSIAAKVDDALAALPPHSGPTIRVAVMGCEVNGPGEAADADIGVACGKSSALLFIHGKKVRTLPPPKILHTLLAEVRKLTAHL